MNWTDFAVIVIVGGLGYLGYRRGLLVTLIRFVKLIASLLIAKMFHRPFVDLVFSATGASRDKILLDLQTFLSDLLKIQLTEASPISSSQMSAALDQIAVPRAVQDAIHSELAAQAVDTANQFLRVVSEQLADVVIYSIGFVVLAVLTFIGFTILEKVSKLVTSLPIISTFDHGGGLLIGAAQGVLVVMFLIFAANTFRGNSFAADAMKAIDESAVARYFRDYNLIFLLLKAFVVKGV